MPTISYADVLETTPLPIDAANLVSKATVIVAGNRAGLEPDFISNVRYDFDGVDNINLEAGFYISMPAVFEFESPEHTVFKAQRAFALPDYVTPFLEPDATLPLVSFSSNNINNPAFMQDGEVDTFAEITEAFGSATYTKFGNHAGIADVCIGFRVTYKTKGAARISIKHGSNFAKPDDDVAVRICTARFNLPESEEAEEIVDVYAIFPPDIRISEENFAAIAPSTGEVWENFSTELQMFYEQVSPSDSMQIYQFYPLILDLAVLERIAASNIRLPAVKPKRVTVKGCVAPGDSLTITGFPGGDMTAPIASLEYPRNSRDGEVTVITLEQDASSDEPDAGEARRAFARAVVGRIQTGTYGLTMGARL